MNNTIYDYKTLTEWDEQLKAAGINLIVNSVEVQQDFHMIGSSVYVTIQAFAHHVQVEEVNRDAYDRAMELLRG